MNKDFDYEGAKKAGYSDSEIFNYLANDSSSKTKKPSYENSSSEDSPFTKIAKNFRNFFGNLGNPIEKEEKEEREESKLDKVNQKLLNKVDFDAESALEAGYSADEINDYLKESQPKKGTLEKSLRTGAQYGLGLLEGSAPGFAYDVAVSPIASESAMGQLYREGLLDDIERLREQKEAGIWDDSDQKLYDHLQKQIENPEEAKQFVQTADVSIRGLAEKATGQDLTPEGFTEKAAHLLGFIRHPNVTSPTGNRILGSMGLNKNQIIKNLFPSLKEIPRGLGAAAGLELAEKNQLGPIGSMTALVVGDVLGAGVSGTVKAMANPKRTLANLTNFATGASRRKETIAQLVSDFEKSGLQIDPGTLTGSPLVQMMQVRLAESGLTGRAFENARKELSQQVVREYNNIVSDLGAITFENNYQASEAIKDALRVEEINLNIPKERPAGRSLQGRISVQEAPAYQEELLNSISTTEFVNDSQAGLNMKTAAEDIRNPIKQEFSQRWTTFNEMANQEYLVLENDIRENLASEMEEFVREHEGSLLLGESAPEARVVRSAQNLSQQLREAREITISNLIKTKRTLGDIANWEFGGSDFLSAYKQLTENVSRHIEESLSRFSPDLLEEFQQLNAEYSAYKDLFENENVRSLFEPRNYNYNYIHNQFTTNPDKLRALEDIMYSTPRGQQIINESKRDYAAGVINRREISPRDMRNLEEVLGQNNSGAVLRFEEQRQHALEHPLPRPSYREPLPIRPERISQNAPTLINRNISQTASERARTGLRKKYYDYISKIAEKSPEAVMKKMDTISGIRELKRVLSLTEEGKDLFDQLSRFKLAEMIDKKMTENVTGNIKLGTFSGLLKSTKDKSIVKELLGEEKYKALELLQKNSGKLNEAASKFYNASKSGTTLTDVGLVGAAASGILTGNLFLAIPAMAKIGGSRVIANLFVDPVFIKELKNAIFAQNPKKFMDYLNKLEPTVKKAIQDTLGMELLESPQEPQLQDEQ